MDNGKAGSVTSATPAVVSFYSQARPWKYSDDVKQLCIKMYLNGMGLRGIERVTDIHHTTVMGWIKEAGLNLLDIPETDEEPEITDLDGQSLQVGNPAHGAVLMNYKPLSAISDTNFGSGLL